MFVTACAGNALKSVQDLEFNIIGFVRPNFFLGVTFADGSSLITFSLLWDKDEPEDEDEPEDDEYASDDDEEAIESIVDNVFDEDKEGIDM